MIPPRGVSELTLVVGAVGPARASGPWRPSSGLHAGWCLAPSPRSAGVVPHQRQRWQHHGTARGDKCSPPPSPSRERRSGQVELDRLAVFFELRVLDEESVLTEFALALLDALDRFGSDH